MDCYWGYRVKIRPFSPKIVFLPGCFIIATEMKLGYSQRHIWKLCSTKCVSAPLICFSHWYLKLTDNFHFNMKTSKVGWLKVRLHIDLLVKCGKIKTGRKTSRYRFSWLCTGPGIVGHSCNPNMPEEEARGSWFQGHFQLYSLFESSQNYEKLFKKINNTKQIKKTNSQLRNDNFLTY